MRGRWLTRACWNQISHLTYDFERYAANWRGQLVQSVVVATEGNQGVYVLRRIEESRAHFLLLTLWESLDAIKQFAGPDFEKARYYPEDDEYLLERELTVDHYEVVGNSKT